MDLKRKRIILSILAVGLVSTLVGVTFAFFSYVNSGTEIVRVGRISFTTNQSKTITLTNAFPISSAEAATATENVGTFELEVVGDTTYEGGVEYLISITNSNLSVTTGGVTKQIPISIDVTVTSLGTSDNSYFTNRDTATTSIYKKLIGDTITGDEPILVGFIAPDNNRTGVNGKITIKAYFNSDDILISDTDTDNTKTVLTTSEWNALSSSGVSFQVTAIAQEGIWVEEVTTPASCFTTYVYKK